MQRNSSVQQDKDRQTGLAVSPLRRQEPKNTERLRNYDLFTAETDILAAKYEDGPQLQDYPMIQVV